MFSVMRDVWATGNSMIELSALIANEANTFSDIDAVGVYVDNHLYPRFLYS